MEGNNVSWAILDLVPLVSVLSLICGWHDWQVSVFTFFFVMPFYLRRLRRQVYLPNRQTHKWYYFLHTWFKCGVGNYRWSKLMLTCFSDTPTSWAYYSVDGSGPPPFDASYCFCPDFQVVQGWSATTFSFRGSHLRVYISDSHLSHHIMNLMSIEIFY